MMEEDFDALFGVYCTDAMKHVFENLWTEESLLFEENSSTSNTDRDIQDTRNEENYSSSESETESLNPSTISDEQIQNLRVQDLNKLLRDLPRDEAAKIKKRRRNLKNRNYALNCRIRKQQKYEDLLNENFSLKEQLESERSQLRNVWKEKEAFKKKYQHLQKSFTVYMQSKISTELPA